VTQIAWLHLLYIGKSTASFAKINIFANGYKCFVTLRILRVSRNSVGYNTALFDITSDIFTYKQSLVCDQDYFDTNSNPHLAPQYAISAGVMSTFVGARSYTLVKNLLKNSGANIGVIEYQALQSWQCHPAVDN
jgi:hypothetical protein